MFASCFVFHCGIHQIFFWTFESKKYFGMYNFKGLKFLFLSFSSGSIELLGSQAILLRSPKRRSSCCAQEPFILPTTISANMGSTVSCCTSCSQASRTRSRCLLNSHFTHSKHTHHVLNLIFLQPFLVWFPNKNSIFLSLSTTRNHWIPSLKWREIYLNYLFKPQNKSLVQSIHKQN